MVNGLNITTIYHTLWEQNHNMLNGVNTKLVQEWYDNPEYTIRKRGN